MAICTEPTPPAGSSSSHEQSAKSTLLAASRESPSVASAVNTLRLARRMAEGGMPQKQADAVAEAINDEIGADLATKADLKAGLSQLETRLVKWMIGQGIATVGLIVALLKLLP